MAKPYLNRAGNGMHMHVSLLDGLSRNVFDGGAAIASDTLRHAIGGVLEVLPESMAFLAPNVNSYRRNLPDIFVPTQRRWGFENRPRPEEGRVGQGGVRECRSRCERVH